MIRGIVDGFECRETYTLVTVVCAPETIVTTKDRVQILTSNEHDRLTRLAALVQGPDGEDGVLLKVADLLNRHLSKLERLHLKYTQNRNKAESGSSGKVSFAALTLMLHGLICSLNNNLKEIGNIDKALAEARRAMEATP